MTKSRSGDSSGKASPDAEIAQREKVEQLFQRVGMRGRYLETSMAEYDAVVAAQTDETLSGIMMGLRRYGVDVQVKHNPASTLQKACGKVIKAHFRRRGANPFVWSGDDIDDGLAAFAEWLSEYGHHRLISVTTNADYHYAFVCPLGWVTDVLGMLEELDVTGEMVGGPSSLPPVQNLKEMITVHLASELSLIHI